MDIWVRAGQLMLSLSILVVLHEFGHYLPAVFFKTRVEKFYLFFNPWFSLFKKKIGDTEWGIGWLPLGGYVKIAGMVDESMDKEQLALPAQPWEFRSKKAWQRLIIMIGGVTVNLIVGVLIYIFVVFAYGEEKLYVNDLKQGLAVHPYLAKYGIQSGDVIVSMEGEKVVNALDPNKGIMLRDARNLEVKHPDGSISKVKLPEFIDYNLFKAGAFPAFELRFKSNSIGALTCDKALTINKSSVEKGDLLYDFAETDKKELELSLIRGKDSLLVKFPASAAKKVRACFPAMQKGLLPKDKFLSINGEKIEFFDNITGSLYAAKGKKIPVTIVRENQTMNLEVQVTPEGKLGFAPNKPYAIDKKSIRHEYYSFGESISVGLSRGYWTLNDYASQIRFIFTEKGASSLGGFGSMGKLFPPVWDWEIFWLNTALISIILAFMNILPIPALDGGHVVFLIYEMITGKEAPQKVLEYAQYVGIVLLLGLMLYANGNDIYQAFFK